MHCQKDHEGKKVFEPEKLGLAGEVKRGSPDRERMTYRGGALLMEVLYCNSRKSQARAALQSRFTVAGDVPIAVAISSISKPPKNFISTICA